VTPLATIGSTAPFIGLFGTVWGVIDAFESIGTAGSASLAVVAPGVAEALVATGAGLVAAVPAVWFYNGLSAALRRFGAELEAVGAEVLNCYDRGVAAGGRARTPASPQSAWER
jgi:biopolymer transport protein TolQ